MAGHAGRDGHAAGADAGDIVVAAAGDGVRHGDGGGGAAGRAGPGDGESGGRAFHGIAGVAAAAGDACGQRVAGGDGVDDVAGAG